MILLLEYHLLKVFYWSWLSSAFPQAILSCLCFKHFFSIFTLCCSSKQKIEKKCITWKKYDLSTLVFILTEPVKVTLIFKVLNFVWGLSIARISYMASEKKRQANFKFRFHTTAMEGVGFSHFCWNRNSFIMLIHTGHNTFIKLLSCKCRCKCFTAWSGEIH